MLDFYLSIFMIRHQWKKLSARIVTHRSVGKGVALLTHNRIRQYGCLYATHAKEVIDPVKASLFWGLYEKEEANFISKYLSGKYPVIELGGSLGVISCVAGKKLQGKKLIIVEANKSLIPVIEENLKLNGIFDYVIEWGGIGSGEQLYFLEGDRSYKGKVTTQFTPGCVPVKEIDLLSLLDRYNISSFSLISDIEGGENSFLFEHPEGLIHCKEMIIELHETNDKGNIISVSSQKAQIEKSGFKITDTMGTVIYARREG